MSDDSNGCFSQWCSGAGTLLPALVELDLSGSAKSPLVPVRRLLCRKLSNLTPIGAKKAISQLGILEGWAIAHASSGSAAGPFPQIANIGTGYLSAEIVATDNVALRLAPDQNGSLAIWLYGEALPDEPFEGFDTLEAIEDLLRETTTVLSHSDQTPARIVYHVYWQATREFGLRPRLSLFAGFLDGEDEL